MVNKNAMPFVTGTSELAEKLVKALGLPAKTYSLSLDVKADEIVSVSAVFYPTETQLEEVLECFQEGHYALVQLQQSEPASMESERSLPAQ
jgi:hypothetical protein